MPRRPTDGCGGLVFHVMNRAARRTSLFDCSADYAAFLQVLCEALTKRPMRLIAFALMKTHWHLALWPIEDRDLSRFMHWLTLTHAKRWQRARGTAGTGALYQAPFKAIPVQSDGHFYRMVGYVERNPVRAGIVNRAEEWPWSSASGHPAGPRPPLHQWPMVRPPDWLELLTTKAACDRATEALRQCIRLTIPYGTRRWRFETATRLGWDATLHECGRPSIDGSRHVKLFVQSQAF